MMEVVVRLFAMYREAAGRSKLRWEIEEGATVGDLWRELQEAYPRLPKVQPAAAINAEYARMGETLQTGDEVAFLPPVSGGASSDMYRKNIEPNLGKISASGASKFLRHPGISV